MTTIWAILVIVVATSVSVAALLLVRRNAPDGGYFHDGDRAAGVFGVLATGFSVLLGFVIFLAFESYDSSRSGASAEATIVAQQFETTGFMPPAARKPLGFALICYGRSVVNTEWDALASGNGPSAINPWGVALFRTLQTVNPKTPAEQAAYGKWLDQTSDREQARNDRLHSGEGVIPRPLWLVLFLSAGMIFCFMLFFADSGERKIVQGVQIGVVTAILSASLLLLRFLDHPYNAGAGSLRPVAMERTLRTLDLQRQIAGYRGALPCDARGVPLASP